MKKSLLRKLSLLLLAIVSFSGIKSQNVLYRDTLIQGATYCPTGTYAFKWAKYKNFRAALDTNSKYFTEVRMWGEVASNAGVGSRTCTDRNVVNRLADALKNGTGYVGTCNGFYWDVSAAGTCSATGCGAPSSEVIHFASYPISSGTLGVCVCGGTDFWVIRSTIQNANKGGVMIGGTGTTCNPTTQWIELEFKAPPPTTNDVWVQSISKLDLCAYTQDIRAKFKNLGTARLDSFQYYYKVNSTVTGPVWRKVNLASGRDTTITLVSNYSLTANTDYNLTVWSDKPNNLTDGRRVNDTAKSFVPFKGVKGVPDLSDTAVCGSQSIILRAKPARSGDSISWYSDRALTKMLGKGVVLKTPFMASGSKYKYYAASYADKEKLSLSLGLSPPAYGYPSSMFDLRTKAGDLTIDSIALNIYDFNFSAGTNLDIELYMREGSFTDAGATTNSSMWNKVTTATVTSMGSAKPSILKCKIDLKGNTNYAFYVNPTVTGSNTILAKLGSLTYQNNDLLVAGGTLNQLNFGTAITGYTLDGIIHYNKLLCKSVPDSAVVDVKPAPFGAKLTAGTPFQTSPKKSGSGAMGLPHVVALGDTLALNLTEPTGYTNSGHSTTWKVASVVMKSATGRSITGYTWTDPTSSDAGRLKFSPNSTEIDSQLVAEIRIQDLGPYFCDTLIRHHFYVAPLPEPIFTRTARVCEGDVVEFKNSSKIQSGFLDYKWYFGDGDSSEVVDPFHFYPGAGVYYAKLDAISSIYGYIRSKKDTITVTRLPKVDFKVFNVCEKQSHRFVNNTTATGTVTYKWNFGTAPGVQSTVKDPTFKYTNAGQYKVTLTAEANGCPATLVKNAYLFPTPKAAFTYPNAPGTKFCSNAPVDFTNQSTILSGNIGGKWLFGDGAIGTVRNPQHTFATGGTYTVQHIAISDFGCSDTVKKSIIIGSAPVVSWSNGQVCDQTPTQFTNNTAAISGFTSSPSWTFGDGNKSGADNPSHQYTVLGPKTVKLVVSVNNGCKDSLEKTVNVGVQATVDFSVANTCSGQAVQFDNKTTWKQGNIVYEWDFGDGSPLSNTPDPLHTYTTATSFAPNVKLRAIVDGACESIVTKPLQVFQLPSCAFTITDDWTPGEGFRTIKVQAANTTYPFYRFKFSDGGSINASSGVYQFPYEGDFTVTLFARNSADCECNTSQVKAIRNSVGVENLKGGEVRLFPNPSTGLVNIEAGSAIKGVEVYNVLGEKAIVSQSITGQTGNLKFNGLSNGVYLVKITTDLGTVTQRVTIAK